jgi:hypothetical protein
MVRTQIYLTESEKEHLDSISKIQGKTQSELIRTAIDQYVESHSRSRINYILNKAAGLWKDRQDLELFDKIRKSWDRESS